MVSHVAAGAPRAAHLHLRGRRSRYLSDLALVAVAVDGEGRASAVWQWGGARRGAHGLLHLRSTGGAREEAWAVVAAAAHHAGAVRHAAGGGAVPRAAGRSAGAGAGAAVPAGRALVVAPIVRAAPRAAGAAGAVEADVAPRVVLREIRRGRGRVQRRG